MFTMFGLMSESSIAPRTIGRHVVHNESVGVMRKTVRTLVAGGLLIAAILSSGPLVAGGWGSVDQRLLLTLHPAMATFDYSHGRFLRSSATTGNPAMTAAKLQREANESQSAVQKLARERAGLISQRGKILARREDTLDNIRGKKSNPGSGAGAGDRLAEEYEARYAKEIGELDLKLASVEQQLEDAREATYAPAYLTKKETGIRIIAIRTEIGNLIAQVAKEQDLDMVVDDSLGRPWPEAGRSAEDYFSPPVPFNKGALLFRSFAEWEPINVTGTVPGPGGKPVPASQHIAMGRSLNVLRQLQNYLNFLPYRISGAPMGQSMVLVGNTDLTIAVAQRLYTAYRLPAERQGMLLGLIQKFQQIESVPGAGQ